MNKIREYFQALSGGGFKGIEQQALAKAVGVNLNAYKPADQSVTSSTALVDDDSLAIEVPIGATAFTFDVPVSMAAAGGLKVALAAGNGMVAGLLSASAVFFLDATASAVKTMSTLGSSVTGGTSSAWTRLRITGSILVTNPGVLKLQFAQDTSNGTATKTLAGATVVSTQITTA